MRSKFIQFALMLLMTLTIATQLYGQAQAAVSQEMSKTVNILGRTLTLRRTQGGNPGQPFMAEYLADGEQGEHWTMMYTAMFVPEINAAAKPYAEGFAQKVLSRKQEGDKVANAAVFEATDPNSAIVDFVISVGDEVEHNVLRVFSCERGMVMIQIARRAYENKTNEQEMKDFIKSIETKRTEHFKEINRTDLPYKCY